MYIAMMEIRLFEERVADLITQKEIICPCHLYIGEEAVAVGVCFALSKDNYVFNTHRSHGHYFAKGGDVKKLMAELYGKKTGCSRGLPIYPELTNTQVEYVMSCLRKFYGYGGNA